MKLRVEDDSGFLEDVDLEPDLDGALAYISGLVHGSFDPAHYYPDWSPDEEVPPSEWVKITIVK